MEIRGFGQEVEEIALCGGVGEELVHFGDSRFDDGEAESGVCGDGGGVDVSDGSKIDVHICQLWKISVINC